MQRIIVAYMTRELGSKWPAPSPLYETGAFTSLTPLYATPAAPREGLLLRAVRIGIPSIGRSRSNRAP